MLHSRGNEHKCILITKHLTECDCNRFWNLFRSSINASLKYMILLTSIFVQPSFNSSITKELFNVMSILVLNHTSDWITDHGKDELSQSRLNRPGNSNDRNGFTRWSYCGYFYCYSCFPLSHHIRTECSINASNTEANVSEICNENIHVFLVMLKRVLSVKGIK